jgi:anti-sigma regulatory factor (Ser/Thr protein kinase)
VTQDSFVARFEAQPSSVPLARRAVVAYATAHGVTDPGDVELAVSEAVTNAVIHAYLDRTAGTIEVTARRDPDNGVEITVSDDGHGVTPRPDSPGLGLGLPLIARLAEECELTPGPEGGCRVRMVFAAK